MVEQRTDNIAGDLISTSTHVDNPLILLQISNVDLVFELDTGAAVSLVQLFIYYHYTLYYYFLFSPSFFSSPILLAPFLLLTNPCTRSAGGA